MDENKILFVDLDGTLIREDLSNLAFINFLKNNPLKLILYLFIFIVKGKPYLKEKISKNFEPLFAGAAASVIIGVLSFLSFETSTGFWLMFSFGSSTLIVLVFHESEFAQPANVFFGHLLGIVIGILFNKFLGMSYLTLGLSVGTTVTLMMYFKIIHPPAAANPLIALFADVSLSYIVFPVIVGSIVIIVLSIIINRYLLKRNYPVRWF